MLAYHRELRAQRRRHRLARGCAQPFAPFAAHGSVMPLLASILAVCLVAGAMLSVATFSPSTTPADRKPARPPRGPASRWPEEHDRRSGAPVRDQRVRGPGEPLRPPVGLVKQTRAGGRHPAPELTRCPALSPAAGTATIAFRPGRE